MRDSTRPTFIVSKPLFVFRIFYDPNTMRCVSKSLGELDGELPYIEVDKETYSKVQVCNNYKIVNGTLTKIKFGPGFKKIGLFNDGQFKTLKNNIMFAVGNDYKGAVDTWDYCKHDE